MCSFYAFLTCTRVLIQRGRSLSSSSAVSDVATSEHPNILPVDSRTPPESPFERESATLLEEETVPNTEDHSLPVSDSKASDPPVPQQHPVVSSNFTEEQSSSVSSPPEEQSSSVNSPPEEQSSSVNSPPEEQSSSVSSPPEEQSSSVNSPPEEQSSSVNSPPEEQSSSVSSPPEEQSSSVNSPPEEQSSSVSSPPEEQSSSVNSPPEEQSSSVSSPPEEQSAAAVSEHSSHPTSPELDEVMSKLHPILQTEPSEEKR